MRSLIRLQILLNAWRRTDAVFDHYRESEICRLLNLFAHVDLDRYRSLRMLEVGAGLGRLGEAFAVVGFDVTSSDGRQEHVESMLRRGRKAVRFDLDTQDLHEVGDFDLVLAFGVLYHLRDPSGFIASCGRYASVVFLETVVTDQYAPELNLRDERSGRFGRDQALHGTGCRPSPSWVERSLRNAGFDSIRDISTGLANWKTGVFDWALKNSGEYRRGGRNLRKMWVAEKSDRLAAPPGPVGRGSERAP